MALALNACAFGQNWNTNSAIPTPLGVFAPSQDKSNILYNQTATAVTANEFFSGASWASAPSGWLTNSEMVQTNGVYAHPGAGFGMVMHSANVASRSNSRFRSTVNIGAEGIHPDGSVIVSGFSTNTIGSLPSDNSLTVGVAAVGLGQSWGLYRMSGISEGSFSNTKYSNGVYNICISTDPTNVSICVLWPGHTNEFRSFVPWENLASSVALSNFVAGLWGGTNVTLIAAGGRTNSQTISPRTGVETSDFVHFTKDRRGDYIRVVVPPQYDSGTNIGNLIVFVHGNTGDYKGDYETIVGDESTTGDSCMGYFNALATNNFILASYLDPNANNGRADSWGTSNSYDCIDATIQWVRQRYAFSNIFLWGESAGGASALGYAAQHREKIAGILMNHAVYNITNFWPARSTDINAAFGGTTPAQFAGYDPSTFAPTVFAGIPIRCTSSTGDTVVPKVSQTDVLVTLMGGTVGGSVTNTPLSPEIDDYAVSGGAGVHGGACYTPAVAAGDIAFLKRCCGYAAQTFTAPSGWTPKIHWNTNSSQATPLQ